MAHRDIVVRSLRRVLDAVLGQNDVGGCVHSLCSNSRGLEGEDLLGGLDPEVVAFRRSWRQEAGIRRELQLVTQIDAHAN